MSWRIGILLMGLSLVVGGRVEAGEVRIEGTEPNGVVVAVDVADLVRQTVTLDGRAFDRVDVPGWMRLFQPGAPAVPIKGVLLGVPFGAQISASVIDATYEEIADVDLMPVAQTLWLGSESHPFSRAVYEPDAAIYGRDAFYPGDEAVVLRTGTLRDQRVAALSVRPMQYNPVRKVLRIARQMRVRVTFAPGASRPAVRPSDEGVRGPFEPVYQNGLLNAEQARAWRGRAVLGLQKQAVDWYDPSATYYKIRIREDGLYRLDADWFADSGIDLRDLSTLKVYLNGAEIPLFVDDGGDGQLDDGDAVLFWGTYRRRADRDFESDYGREHIYFLTTAGGPGRRYADVDATPQNGLPEATHFFSRVHVEIDSTFEAMGLAPDVNRDHWFWQRTGSPSTPEAIPTPVIVPVPLLGLATDVRGDAQIEMGVHSLTELGAVDPDHYAVVQIEDGPVIAERRWDGQNAAVISGTAPVSALSDTARVVLLSPGDPSYPLEPIPYVDHVYFNWITVQYPRRFEAVDGALRFDLDAEGRSVSVGGFPSERVHILNLDRAQRFVGGAVASEGNAFRVRFETHTAGLFVAVDESAIRTPDLAERDFASDLRSAQPGASYVIIAPTDFRAEADELASHRQTLGLSSMVVDVSDIYDEFAFGQPDADALRRFVQHAFETWTERPAYVLLFGRFSFDYRDLFNQARFGRKNFVPSWPFQSVRRGLAYTDEFLGRVDDDLFMDVFVGRFSVNRTSQAQTMVQKTIGYDQTPAAQWRDRVLLMANWDDRDPLLFAGPSDSLGAFADAAGLTPYKVYHDENTPPEPNESSHEVIRQINEGRLIVNFMGHGSASSMSKFLAGTFQQGGFSYMSQIQNGDRLPVMFGMSCLNGLYWDPRIICLAEEMTNKSNGGAIAYISASSLAFIGINNEINIAMFRHFFENGVLDLGQNLALAKADLLAQLPGVEPGVVMINLMGDPATRLAIPVRPDFVPIDLSLDRAGDLTTGDSVRVTLRVENWGITSDAPVDVLMIDQNLETGQTDTLFLAALPAFGQADSATVLWRLGGRAGRHVLSGVVDPSNTIAEGDEENNRVSVDVDVFGALSAVPTLPLNSQVVATSDVVLGVRLGIEGRDVFGEFELGANASFAGDDARQSGAVPTVDGLALWRPVGLAAGAYVWRARLTDGQTAGPWSDVQHVTVAVNVPEREVVWQQDGSAALTLGTVEGAVLRDDGTAGRVQTPPPIQFNTADGSFVAADVAGTAVLCTDGTYLYVKRFFTSQSIYPGTDVFVRIGTGLNGTVAGQNYGVLTDVSIKGISATYHSDGFVYAEHKDAQSVLRISPATGRVDTVVVSDGLLDLARGLVFDDHALITSDGTHIYNVSSGVNGLRRAGWSVRVFAPADGWRLVRSFTVEPTATGFGYLFTDGVIADGRFLYLIEFGTGLTHRVRVVDAQTGAFVTEFESDQAETDILGGQYDWENNLVWLGQLNGPQIYRYPGRRLPDFGAVTSSPIGPASRWLSLGLEISDAGRAEVDLFGEVSDGVFAALPNLQAPAPQTEINLLDQGISARRLKVRIRLFGEGLNPSPGLKTWTVRYEPLSDIGLSNLRADPVEVRELKPVRLTVDIQNRGPLDRAVGVSVGFYSGPPELGRLIGRMAIPEVTPIGQSVPLQMVWQTAQFAGTHPVTARLENFQGQPAFAGRQVVIQEPVVITPSGDAVAPSIEIAALEALGEVRPEDYLPADPTFQITILDSAGIDPSTVGFALRGSGDVREGTYESGHIRDRAVTPVSLSFVYAPAALTDDTYTLEIAAGDKLGNGPARKAMVFQVSSDLAIENALLSPNPIADDGHFTFILSRPAAVTVRVYTVAGRLIARIEEPFGRAGYNQVYWNGRDADGYLLANGTYLYTLSADDGETQVRVKEKLIVYR